MAPKEKAIELFKKYYCMNNDSKSKIKVIGFETSKQCALITVDEIINAIDEDILSLSAKLSRAYWESVKKELLTI